MFVYTRIPQHKNMLSNILSEIEIICFKVFVYGLNKFNNMFVKDIKILRWSVSVFDNIFLIAWKNRSRFSILDNFTFSWLFFKKALVSKSTWYKRFITLNCPNLKFWMFSNKWIFSLILLKCWILWKRAQTFTTYSQ